MEIKYTKFTFHEPLLPGRQEYEELKNVLKSNPQIKLCPSNDFAQRFVLHLVLLASCVILTIIAFNSPNENIQVLFGSIAALLFVSIVLGGLLDTLRSYFVFFLLRRLYYRRLRRNAMDAAHYDDFIMRMKKRSFLGDFIPIFQ